MLVCVAHLLYAWPCIAFPLLPLLLSGEPKGPTFLADDVCDRNKRYLEYHLGEANTLNRPACQTMTDRGMAMIPLPDRGQSRDWRMNEKKCREQQRRCRDGAPSLSAPLQHTAGEYIIGWEGPCWECNPVSRLNWCGRLAPPRQGAGGPICVVPFSTRWCGGDWRGRSLKGTTCNTRCCDLSGAFMGVGVSRGAQTPDVAGLQLLREPVSLCPGHLYKARD